MILQCNSEHRLSQPILHILEESFLGRRPDGIEGAESESEEPIGVLVPLELLAYSRRGADALHSRGNGADGDTVSVDSARCRRVVAV